MAYIPANSASVAQTKSEQMSELSQEILKRADVIGAWASGKIDAVADVATEAGKIAYKEAIDLAMQYVAFGRFYQTTIIIMAIAFFVLFAYSTYKSYVWSNRDEVDVNANPTPIFATIGSVIGCGISFIVLMANIKETVLVWAAPKIWIGIKLAELMK